MTFMPLAVVAAVLLVVATRGSLLRLGRVPFRGLDLLFAGLVIQVLVPLVDLPRARLDDVGFGLLLASYALILTFAFTNLHIRGMSIVAIGIALNAVVIALNQGMPAKGPTRTTTDGRHVSRVIISVKHRPERPGDVLTVLDDRIMLPRPSHDLLSFGDLVLVAGLLDVCYRGSRRDEDAWMSAFAMPIRRINRGRNARARRTALAERLETARAPLPPEHPLDSEYLHENVQFLASDDDVVIDLRDAERDEADATWVAPVASGQSDDATRRATTRSSATNTPSSYK